MSKYTLPNERPPTGYGKADRNLMLATIVVLFILLVVSNHTMHKRCLYWEQQALTQVEVGHK